MILRFVKPDENSNYDPKTSPTQNQPIIDAFELLWISKDINLVKSDSLYNFLCYLQSFEVPKPPSLIDIENHLKRLNLGQKFNKKIMKRKVGYIYEDIFYAEPNDALKIQKDYFVFLTNKKEQIREFSIWQKKVNYDIERKSVETFKP